MRRHPIIFGVIGGWIAMYFIAAFISADWMWLSDLWNWPRGDRAIFLYWVVVCGGLGGLAGHYLRRHILAESTL